jgi:hypothetical protein
VAGFLFRLETVDGVPADPPTLEAAVPNWKAANRSTSSIGRCAWSGRETTTQTSRLYWSLRTPEEPPNYSPAD